MDSLDNLLRRKADDISIDDKVMELDVVKNELKRYVSPKNAQVTAIKDHLVIVSVKSSVFASELRLQQVAFLSAVSKAIDKEMTKLQIKIG